MPPKHDLDGLNENPQVHQQRLLSYVVRIHDHPASIIGVVAAGDLPESGDSRFRGHVGRQVAPIAEHLVLHNRPWADQAHFSTEHVPDLRQFIETGFAQESPQARDAWISAQLMVAEPFGPGLGIALEQVVQDLLGVRDHGAELQALERAAALADAAVAEQNGAVFDAHAHGNDEQQGREREPDRQRADDVEHPFEGTIRA